MKLLFLWLDAHAWLYWALGVATWLTLAAWVRHLLVQRDRVHPFQRDGLTFGLLAALVLAWRWPVLFEMHSVGSLEPLLLTRALAEDASWIMPVGGLTGNSGALASLALIPSHWLGVPQDTFNARLVGLLLDLMVVATLYFTIRRYRSPPETLVWLLPIVVLFSTATLWPFFQYSSWHVCWSLALVARVSVQTHARSRTSEAWVLLVIATVALALVPWTHRFAWAPAIIV